MEMHQIRYFLAMSRALNFTRAADDCNVSQPALTRAIQKLEDELGGPLFRRERSRTHLTDLGRLMLPHLERTFEAAQAAKALAKGIGKAQVTPLALGVAATVDCNALDLVIAEIARDLPGFELSVVTGSSSALIELGLGGGLDLIIVEAPDDAPERLEAWDLYEHVYHVLTRADHPLAGEPALRLEALREEHWIDYDGDAAAFLRTHAGVAGFDPDFRHRADSLAQVRRLILAGLGSAFAPPARTGERVVALRLIDVAAARRVVLAAIAGRRRSVAADSFVRAARARSWAEAG